MNDTTTSQGEPGTDGSADGGSGEFPELLTVEQAFLYLPTHGLQRTQKTIRKWCRLGHVEAKPNTIPGGPKWLIVRASLDAKIEEEKVIERVLVQTSLNPFEPVRTKTSPNRSEPVHSEDMVHVLAKQLVEKDKQIENQTRTSHEREMALNGIIQQLNDQHHQLARDLAQVGIAMGNAMQLRAPNEPGSTQFRQDERRTEEAIKTPVTTTTEETDMPRAGDNPGVEINQARVNYTYGEGI